MVLPYQVPQALASRMKGWSFPKPCIHPRASLASMVLDGKSGGRTHPQTSLNDLVLDAEAGKFKSLKLRQLGATSSLQLLTKTRTLKTRLARTIKRQDASHA